MAPFEDEGGGGGEPGGGEGLVLSFGGVTAIATNTFRVTLVHSGSSLAPHTLSFQLRCTHCGINGVSGLHEISVTGDPDIPSENAFTFDVVSMGFGSNATVRLGNLLLEEEVPVAADINATNIPATYGSPRAITLDNY